MARFAECQNVFARPVPGDDDEDWGSDFEGELCSQEIEDNKINEIREANLLKYPPNNVQALGDDNSQTIQKMTENHSLNTSKTGAIPKTGFSYLNNAVNIDSNRAFQKIGKESVHNALPQRQASTPDSHSRNNFMNSESYERQPQTNSNDEAVSIKTPRKLKPEAFSFLNKLPQGNAIESGSDRTKERKTLVSTAFSQAEKLNISQSNGDSNMTLSDCSDVSIPPIPSAPPLQNTSNNYELITEESFSEFDFPSSTVEKEIEKPPLPARPPPVFKYPPETFSNSRSPSKESSFNLAFSKPVSQSASANPKLVHSISSPDSDLKSINVTTQDNKPSREVKNRKSLPSIPVYPTVPKRPLPPLPNAATDNSSRIKSQGEIAKIESSDSVKDNKRLEPAIIDTISIPQRNQISECGSPSQHTAFKEQVITKQLISSPQHRLAQILTNQTNVNNQVLISQQKIVSSTTSSVVGSQNSSLSRLKKTEESDFQNGGVTKELRMIPGRSIENDVEPTMQVESERQPSYLEAKEVINPRRFTDHETLINAMNRPALPQKAPPMQRSVSCNSLVQSIKDLSFSVWSKPEKKRNSDGISLAKKNQRTTSLTSSKVLSTVPLQLASTPTDVSINVNNLQHGKNDVSLLEEKGSLQEYPWFHEVDAKEGQLRLLSVGQDGTFLIRPSSRPTADIHNTMCIFYSGKVRNLHIRTTTDGYVLGTKKCKTFSSLTEMIRHHRQTPVEILPQGSTSIKPLMYRILLTETPPKLQKLFAVV